MMILAYMALHGLRVSDIINIPSIAIFHPIDKILVHTGMLCQIIFSAKMNIEFQKKA